MDRITRLKKDIEELKEQKRQAEEVIKQADAQCAQNYREIIQAYRDFYTRKTNKEFVLYEKFPNVEDLELYVQQFGEFPLYDSGVLNAKELAEIIKHIYQFKTGQKYDIFTFGAVESNHNIIYGDQSFITRPHLFFMIGNSKTLNQYQELNEHFINEDLTYSMIRLIPRTKDLVVIDLDTSWENRHSTLDISCLTGNSDNEIDFINYYDDAYNMYRFFSVSSDKQIFATRSRIARKLAYCSKKVKGIKEVLDFDIHHMDSYIAKILISIIIYKRNNGITELTDDDYNHIFGVLYGEKVSIKESADKDIPKQLIYVPNKKSGK